MPWGTGPGRPISEGLLEREKLGPLRAAAGRMTELAQLVEGFKLKPCKAKLCKISRDLLPSSEELCVANKAFNVMRDNNKASQRGKKRISNLLRSIVSEGSETTAGSKSFARSHQMTITRATGKIAKFCEWL
jgi:hypothetical protein